MTNVDRMPELLHYDMGNGVMAFSTMRRGGYSEGPYGEFNINGYCGDDEACIAKNREALCRQLDIGIDHLVIPQQTHGTKVQKIDESFLALSPEKRQAALEGVDALISDLSGICIGVSTADCIPLLLYDAEHHALAAVHAGWRGTVKRIVMKAVERMRAAYGTRPEHLVAQIGPGISLNSFEVGDEVYEAFQDEGFDLPAISRRYPSQNGSQKWHIDLPACNRQQLLDAGLLPSAISDAQVCTFVHHDVFFSARRLGIHSGRIFTGIIQSADICQNQLV